MNKQEYDKMYYRKNRDKRLKQCKQYRLDNIEKEKLRSKKYYQDNKESYLEYSRAYSKIYCQTERGKELAIIRSQRRRALKASVKDTLTPEQWKQVLIDYDHMCLYCGSKDKLTIDHFIPYYKGGENTVDNVVPACSYCNSSKGAKDFQTWYPTRSK